MKYPVRLQQELFGNDFCNIMVVILIEFSCSQRNERVRVFSDYESHAVLIRHPRLRTTVLVFKNSVEYRTREPTIESTGLISWIAKQHKTEELLSIEPGQFYVLARIRIRIPNKSQIRCSFRTRLTDNDGRVHHV